MIFEDSPLGAFEMKDGKTSRVYGLPFCVEFNEKEKDHGLGVAETRFCEVAIEITVDWPD